MATRRGANSRLYIDEFLDNIINEHRRRAHATEVEVQDFLDILLQLQSYTDKEAELTDDHMRELLLELVLDGTDTSTQLTVWAVAALLKHPKMLSKAQHELDSVVGKKRVVEESDLDSLPYLRAVANETMRLHATTPC